MKTLLHRGMGKFRQWNGQEQTFPGTICGIKSLDKAYDCNWAIEDGGSGPDSAGYILCDKCWKEPEPELSINKIPPEFNVNGRIAWLESERDSWQSRAEIAERRLQEILDANQKEAASGYSKCKHDGDFTKALYYLGRKCEELADAKIELSKMVKELQDKLLNINKGVIGTGGLTQINLDNILHEIEELGSGKKQVSTFVLKRDGGHFWLENRD